MISPARKLQTKATMAAAYPFKKKDRPLPRTSCARSKNNPQVCKLA